MEYCVICYDSLNYGNESYKLHCNHKFHTSCIRRWYIQCHENRSYDEMMKDPCGLNLKNPCPICRKLSDDGDWDEIINGELYKNL